jgi:hypothetical protein
MPHKWRDEAEQLACRIRYGDIVFHNRPQLTGLPNLRLRGDADIELSVVPPEQALVQAHLLLLSQKLGRRPRLIEVDIFAKELYMTISKCEQGTARMLAAKTATGVGCLPRVDFHVGYSEYLGLSCVAVAVEIARSNPISEALGGEVSKTAAIFRTQSIVFTKQVVTLR